MYRDVISRNHTSFLKNSQLTGTFVLWSLDHIWLGCQVVDINWFGGGGYIGLVGDNMWGICFQGFHRPGDRWGIRMYIAEVFFIAHFEDSNTWAIRRNNEISYRLGDTQRVGDTSTQMCVGVR